MFGLGNKAITRTTARMANRQTRYDSSKVKSRLGMEFRSLEETIRDSCVCFLATQQDGCHHLYHLNMHNFSHIRHIFFDLDNTLWDFSANSHRILYEMYQAFDLQEMGIHAFDSFHDQYRMRNSHLWSEYKLGNKTREEVRLERFQHTLYDHGIDNRLMAMRLADYYIENTRRVKDLVPGAVELLEELSAKYPLHIITNGFEEGRISNW